MKTIVMCLLVSFVLIGCGTRENKIDALIETIMSSPDSLDSVLAKNEISKTFHDSIFVHYSLDQQIGFVKEIGDSHSLKKSFIVNGRSKYNDIEAIVISKDGSKWLEFRFVWVSGQYLLIDFFSHIAHG